MKNRKLFPLIFLSLVFIGCAPVVEQSQSKLENSGIPLSEGGSVGQTFVARFDGLEAVEFYFQPTPNGSGQFQLSLRSDLSTETEIANAAYPVELFQQEGFHRLSFAAQQDSHGRYYFVQMKAIEGGSITLGTASGDAYLDGSMYQEGIPKDAQLSFRLIYDPFRAIIGVSGEILKWIGILFISLLLYMLPGLAILHALWPRSEKLTWVVRFTLSPGISLVVYPLLFLLTDLVGLHLGPIYAWLPVLASVTYFSSLLWRKKIDLKILSFKSWLNSETLWVDLTLLLVIGLTFLVRFASIRSIDLPMWGDSLQHTIISQLISENGGLFSSWSPYADLKSFTYHYGFHANVAVFHWLTGRSVIRSTLWVGQIFNALAVISIFPLAIRIGRNRWAGVIAIVISGMLTQVPMVYTNWGRYTQLAGQIILPAMIYLIWSALESQKPNFGLMGMGWLLLSGLGLTHYRILIFGILSVPVIFFLSDRQVTFKDRLSRITVIGIGSILLAVPWFIRIIDGVIVEQLIDKLTTPVNSVSNFLNSYNRIGELSIYMPLYIWGLTLISVLITVLRRDRNSFAILIWWMLVLLSANPGIIGLPGTGAVSNYAVFIASYIPAGILIGGSAALLLPKMGKALQAAFCLVLIGIAIAGVNIRLNDISPSRYSLTTRPDIQAASWIKENIPEDSKFLVNSFFAYDDDVIVGSDAGWWLPLLSGSNTTLPPLTYSFELGPTQTYREDINELWFEIATKGVDHPDVLRRMEMQAVSHVFIGQRQGGVNYFDPQILLANDLNESPVFERIYQKDRVSIFEILYP